MEAVGKLLAAKTTLQELTKKCGDLMGSDAKHWVANDLALTQLRLGDKSGCLKTLDSMQHLVNQLHAGYDGLGYDQERIKGFKILAHAVETNQRLCGKKAH